MNRLKNYRFIRDGIHINEFIDEKELFVKANLPNNQKMKNRWTVLKARSQP